MSGPKHYWRFAIMLDDGQVVADRGWGYREDVALADLSRKLAKEGWVAVTLKTLGRICPPHQHIHRDEAGMFP